MIISVTPLRLCLGGGGTDLPSYAHKYGGFWVSAAIDKYVTVCLEDAPRHTDSHYDPVVQQFVERITGSAKYRATTVNDLPPGIGLGSSGAMCVGIATAFHGGADYNVTCVAETEIDVLGVGYQDTFAAYFGGTQAVHIDEYENMRLVSGALCCGSNGRPGDQFGLYWTGLTHNASQVLREQNQKTLDLDAATIDRLHETKRIGYATVSALTTGNLDDLGPLFNEHWELKRHLGAGVSSPPIEEWRSAALQAGASGVKLVGAGGGGCLLCYCPNGNESVTARMTELGLQYIPFKFVREGSKVVFNG